MRAAFSDALVAAARRNPKTLLLTGDHGYALFDNFRKACPAQYINCGIAEQNMVGVAAGLAKAGFRPIVYGLAAFVPIRVLEQIKIDVCYESLAVTFIGDGAGLVYSHLGTSHQSTEDIACTRALPSLTVLSPADRFEMSACMRLAVSAAGPTYLRMGKSDCGDVHLDEVSLANGELLRVGDSSGDLAFIATGSMVTTARQLAEEFHAEVWSAPCLKPLSEQAILDISSRTIGVVTLEEHSDIGGLGSCIAEVMTGLPRPRPVCRIGVQDRFSDACGSWDYLLRRNGLDSESIRRRISAFVDALKGRSL